MATDITFRFKTGQVYSFVQDNLFARSQFLGAKGYAIRTNGYDPQLKIDPDAGISDLILRAPVDEISPAVSALPDPTGKIFGNGYKWRIRYKNSQTGEVSGLSPLPDVGMNLGVLMSSGSASYMGQRAYFQIYGVNSTFTSPLATTRVGVDTIQLIRNTSAQENTWYVIDEKSNPGASSIVSFEDNFADEEIWNNEVAEATDVESGRVVYNPSYFVPHPPPCARSFLHGTGRVWLYGTIPMGAYRAGTAAVTAGSNTVTGTGTHWHRGLEGQKFRFLTDPDRVIYRIVQVSNQTSMAVTPVPPADVAATTYEIIDDRDGRNIYMLQPTNPTQFDPLDVLTVGLDRADPVKFVFGIGSSTFALTRKRLFELQNSQTKDPKTSTRFVERASVGCVGLWAACMTPFGCVFVSDTGVMLFDGEGLPVPLGGSSPLDDFLPKTQFEAMDTGVLNDIYTYWDESVKRVGVSFCPTGVFAQTRQLSFDPKAGWRGPWRRPVFSYGVLRNAKGSDAHILGDQFGNLLLDGDIVTDVAAAGTGTVSTRDSLVQFTATAAVFTQAMIGSSLVFNDGAGNYYVNWIAGFVSTTKVVLALVPSTVLVAAWTFQIGGIHWTAKTAFIDLGEPGQQKTIREMMLRWQRISAGSDNLVIDAVNEGVSITEAADSATTTWAGGLIKGTAGLNVGGTAFTLRFSGRAIYGNPQVTNILAHINVKAGGDDPATGDRKKVVISQVVTS